MDVHFLEPVLEHDMTVSLLGEVAYYDDGNSKHCIRTALKGRFVRFMGTLPPNVTVVLIVGAKVHMTGNQATLFAIKQFRDHTSAFQMSKELSKFAQVQGFWG